MRKFIALTLVSVFSFSATASDHWDMCSSADGSVKMENGVLTIEGIGETTFSQLIVVSTLKNEEENCILKGAGTEVVSHSNTVSVEEVQYTTEENDPASSVYLICERGGSGIPANDECR